MSAREHPPACFLNRSACHSLIKLTKGACPSEHLLRVCLVGLRSAPCYTCNRGWLFPRQPREKQRQPWSPCCCSPRSGLTAVPAICCGSCCDRSYVCRSLSFFQIMSLWVTTAMSTRGSVLIRYSLMCSTTYPRATQTTLSMLHWGRILGCRVATFVAQYLIVILALWQSSSHRTSTTSPHHQDSLARAKKRPDARIDDVDKISADFWMAVLQHRTVPTDPHPGALDTAPDRPAAGLVNDGFLHDEIVCRATEEVGDVEAMWSQETQPVARSRPVFAGFPAFDIELHGYSFCRTPSASTAPSSQRLQKVTQTMSVDLAQLVMGGCRPTLL
jgi:hypothetical protein